MTRIILAAAAAFALVSAAPAFACTDCAQKDKVAAADKKDEKKCNCGATSAKDCKCGGKCDCHVKKDEKKEEKKS
jgi:hypothetical protein